MEQNYWAPEIETMDPIQLRRRQLQSANDIVRYAYENSTLYKSLYDKVGYDPSVNMDWSDFQKLPTINKCVLREDITGNPPFGNMMASNEESIVYMASSSGTTGQPVISPFNQKEFEAIVDISARFFYAHGLRKTDRYIHCLNLSLFVASPSVLSAQRIGAATIWGGVLPQERLELLLRTLGISTMLTTPSYAWRFGASLRSKGVDPKEELSVRRIIVAGEPGGSIPETRKAISDVWGGIEIGEVYGLSEVVGCMAGSCSVHEGLHIAEDHFIIEILNPDSNEVMTDGERGEIAVTALSKTTRPMIRYRTGDIGWLNRETCSCGRTHARINVVGRKDNMFIVSGVNVFPSDIEGVVRLFPFLTGEYQIKVRNYRMSTCYEMIVERYDNADISDDGIREQLSVMLKKIILAAPLCVSVVPENTMERQSMKAKRFIDERPKL